MVRRACLTLLCTLAAIGLVASAVWHLSTFFGIDPIAKAKPLFLGLHVGVFIVFIPAIFAAKYWPQPPGKHDGQEAQSDQKLNVSRTELGRVATTAGLMVSLTAFCFVYAIVNFVVGLCFLWPGGPHEVDGGYAIMNHGRFVRAITEAEFHQYQGYVARMFSGHWMVFYSGSMLAHYFALKAPIMQPARPEHAEGRE